MKDIILQWSLSMQVSQSKRNRIQIFAYGICVKQNLISK